MSTALRWSAQFATDLAMRRMSGEKSAKEPVFWPGRPSHYHGDCPLIADGEHLAAALSASEAIANAQIEMQFALTSSHEHTDQRLSQVQKYLREAIAEIEHIRQRIIGADAIFEAIEREESAS
jgi:hypothetical protein